MTAPSGPRLTLRDLPLPAKLVVTTFLISVGLGYLWAMAQIHFKHASPGNPMPTMGDLVEKFSGVPWPIEPKPDGWPAAKAEQAEQVDLTAFKKPGIKIKTIIDTRCVTCHRKNGGEKSEQALEDYEEVKRFAVPSGSRAREKRPGKMHDVLQGKRDNWPDNMVAALFEKSQGWDQLTPEQRKAAEPRRENERLALVAWIEAGAPKEAYETDRFQLPAKIDLRQFSPALVVETDPDAVAAMPEPTATVKKEKSAHERWDEARARRLNVDHLTQSTHAHLLTFAMLWALTGLAFAFTHYSYFLRCVVSPLVLIAQVVDVACWWLARLDGVGPYFALAIMGTGAVVGLGLSAQIALSLWSMYSKRGRLAIVLLFLIGAGLFGLTYIKVIGPQLQAERDSCAQQEKQG